MSMQTTFNDFLSTFNTAAQRALESEGGGVSALRNKQQLRIEMAALSALATTCRGSVDSYAAYEARYSSITDPVQRLIKVARELIEVASAPPAPPAVAETLKGLRAGEEGRALRDQILSKFSIHPDTVPLLSRLTPLLFWMMASKGRGDVCYYDDSSRELVSDLDEVLGCEGRLRDSFEGAILEGKRGGYFPESSLPKAIQVIWDGFLKGKAFAGARLLTGEAFVARLLTKSVEGSPLIDFNVPKSKTYVKSIVERLEGFDIPLNLSRADFAASDDPKFNQGCEAALKLVKWMKACVKDDSLCVYDLSIRRLFDDLNIGFAIPFKEQCFCAEHHLAYVDPPVLHDWGKFGEETFNVIKPDMGYTYLAFCNTWNRLVAPLCSKEARVVLA